MNIVMRKSSILSTISKRKLAALTSVESFHCLHHSTSSASIKSFEFTENGVFGVQIRVSSCFRAFGLIFVVVRDFHEGSTPFNIHDTSNESKKPQANDDGLEISKLGIASDIVSALADRGITKLFPNQKMLLEPAMQGFDIIGRAKTGTGKTLAYGIPILDKIIQYNSKHGQGTSQKYKVRKTPLALFIAPTRELARQIERELYIAALNLNTLCAYGGQPISSDMEKLIRGVDLVVGTPGRLMDLINRGTLDVSKVIFLVIDEADLMLSVGFDDDIDTILDKLPQDRQSMMFSATMPTWIKKLAQKHLKNPLTIDLVGDSDRKLPDGITLYSIAADSVERASILGPLIKTHGKGGKCIIFTGTKVDAAHLEKALGKIMKCKDLHGDLSQKHRERTLSGFRDGNFNVLIATDVASRGLDIPEVDLVLHFEIPDSSEIFVHRSGRTGRAGKEGTSILIHTDEQRRIVHLMEREIGSTFTELPKICVDDGVTINVIDGFSNRFGSIGNKEGGGGGRSGGYGGGLRGGCMGAASEPNSARSGRGFVGASATGKSGGLLDSSRSGNFGDLSRPHRKNGSGSGRVGGFGDSQNSGKKFF